MKCGNTQRIDGTSIRLTATSLRFAGPSKLWPAIRAEVGHAMKFVVATDDFPRAHMFYSFGLSPIRLTSHGSCTKAWISGFIFDFRKLSSVHQQQSHRYHHWDRRLRACRRTR